LVVPAVVNRFVLVAPGCAATLSVWLTEAAATKLLFPAWLAVIVVTPAALAMTLVPEIEATLVFELV